MPKFLTLVAFLSFAISQSAIAQKNADAAAVKQLVAKNAAKMQFSENDLVNYRVASSYYDQTSGAVIAYLQQTYKGVDVYNALTTVAFKDDKAISVASSKMTELEKIAGQSAAKPVITPVKALQNAASGIQLALNQSFIMPLRQTPDGQEFEYDRLGIGFNNIIVRLMWTNTPDNEDKVQLSWQVAIHTLQSNDYWLIKVDAINGKIIRKENLTARCSWEPVHMHKMKCYDHREYTVLNAGTEGVAGEQAITSGKYKVIPYPNEDPNRGTPALLTDPWSIFPNTNATSLKWNSDGTNDYDSTRGNNVLAVADLDGKNTTNDKSAKSQTAIPNLTFDYTPDFEKDPVNEAVNLNFGLTNLFYWNNIIHDMYYQYGFDEVAGNFQSNNQSRGGSGNDVVYADGADASGTSNANFSTPSDGGAPRMQMFLWSGSVLKIFEINSPGDYAGYIPATESAISNSNKIASKGEITSDVVLFRDFGSPNTFYACGAASNKTELAGKIAFIKRRGCADDELNTFVNKIRNAQTAGAIAVIVGNVSTHPDSSGLLTMSATPLDNTITIPAIFIATADAIELENRLVNGEVVNTTLHAAPRIDGALDNGVVVHEYTHGLSNRLTGGPSTTSCLSNGEQMGEGWSDYYGLMMTTDWANAKTTDGVLARPIGNYAAGYTPEYDGIRNYPYSTDFAINPWTYDSLKLSSRIKEYSFLNTAAIYYTGELWCNTLWEMTWDLAKAHGINKTFWDASKPGGNSIAMKLVTQGMKLQKCNPGCIDGRDGILKADTLLYGGANSSIIWRAFARRGLGYSASQGSNTKIKDGTAAYDLPPAVLPSEWASFTAEKVKNSALLKWTTTAELNVERFVVERTADGVSYTEIGYVKASGNSTAARDYMFTDNNPVKGTNVYRIKSVDADGKYGYSASRSLVFDDIKNLISIAPNPAKDKVVLMVKGNRNTLQVKLFNSLGQQVATYTLGAESMPLDISRYTPGVYYISITGEGINQKEKIVIQ